MRFKSTQNIFNDFLEIFDDNWMDSDKLMLPPTNEWDYSRTLQIEDIDIWEVLYEQGGGVGVYAAWTPYAEFYLIRTGQYLEMQGLGVETYYGPGSSKIVYARCKELNIPLTINKIWVHEEDMWKYSENLNKSNLIII